MDATNESSWQPMALTDVEYQVLRYIRQHPGRSRTEIAATLGLSKSMLTKAVARFDEVKLVTEEQVIWENGERGKPPILLSLRRDAFHSIGVYVNRRICAVVRADLRGKLIYKSLTTLTAEPTTEGVLAEVALAIEISDVPVIGIGHAVPAIVAEDGRLFEVTPTQATLPLKEIAAALRAHFELPVYWENDAYCSATYEASSAYAERRCVFYTALGFGVGGGMVINGSVFRGAYNQAANIGALVPETGPRPSLTDLAKFVGCDLRELSEEVLSTLFASRDPKLIGWIEDRGPRLSKPLSAAVQFFNPDAIVVGGFFPREILEALCSHVNLGAYDIPNRRPLTKPVVEVSRLLGPLGTAEAASLLPVSARLMGQMALMCPSAHKTGAAIGQEHPFPPAPTNRA